MECQERRYPWLTENLAKTPTGAIHPQNIHLTLCQAAELESFVTIGQAVWQAPISSRLEN